MHRSHCCAHSARPRVLAILVAILVASPVAGQELVDPASLLNWEQWKPLDQAVEDRNELQISLRQFENGLALPSAFSHVYRVPGMDDKLMRVNGGVYAVFDESTYAPTITGPAAVVPAGTVFHLGSPFAGSGNSSATRERFGAAPSSIELGLGAAVGQVADPSALRLDLRVDGRVSAIAVEESTSQLPDAYRHTPIDGRRSVANDPVYRWQRIRAIVRDAADRNAVRTNPPVTGPESE